MTAIRDRTTGVGVERLEVGAFTIPTDAPEADGTLEWNSTTIVVVHAHAGDAHGLGYTYADVSTAKLIECKLAGVVSGCDAFAPQLAWAAMVHAIRNLGRPGITSMAIAAVDTALWDLKARLLELPLCALLGAVNDRVPVYGSGGFTSYPLQRLEAQLSGWVQDPARVRAAREAIGPDAELYVDANGAYTRKQALALAQRFVQDANVTWFEEPVSSDDLDGLRLLRDRVPVPLRIAAGEYGYDIGYFRRMLEAGAVDVLQADVTRCAGITELLRVDALCAAHRVPLSLHCGPSIHLHPALALSQLVHLEYFHDHSRIEQLLFDGVASPRGGALFPDLERPGNGLELKRADAERYAA